MGKGIIYYQTEVCIPWLHVVLILGDYCNWTFDYYNDGNKNMIHKTQSFCHCHRFVSACKKLENILLGAFKSGM